VTAFFLHKIRQRLGWALLVIGFGIASIEAGGGFLAGAVFPALLILPGLRAFHLRQREAYGKLGLWGSRLSFGGFALAACGQIWDYVLFDPRGHPMHGVGFFAQLLAIMMIVIGLPAWAAANFSSLSGWRLVIPALWVLYIIGLLLFLFIREETWLYTRYGIDGYFLSDIVLGIDYGLMSLTFWPKEKI
jgi:hypothetical protein